MTRLSVIGSATERIAPDRGTVRLAVGFSGASREEIVARANELHAAVSAELTALAAPAESPLEAWSSGQLRFWSSRPWSEQGEVKPLLHESRAEFAATFTDFPALSAWVAGVTQREGTTLDGIDWTLAEDTAAAVRERAQVAAVRDAAQKAAVYAAALGLGAVTVRELADPGLLSQEGGPTARGGFAGADSLRMAAMPASGGAEFQPGDLSVEATVHVRYDAADASGARPLP